jgi:hypothetical protein
MNVLYKSAFRKFVKKQTRSFQLVIEDETERILKDTEIEEAKKGVWLDTEFISSRTINSNI